MIMVIAVLFVFISSQSTTQPRTPRSSPSSRLLRSTTTKTWTYKSVTETWSILDNIWITKSTLKATKTFSLSFQAWTLRWTHSQGMLTCLWASRQLTQRCRTMITGQGKLETSTKWTCLRWRLTGSTDLFSLVYTETWNRKLSSPSLTLIKL